MPQTATPSAGTTSASDARPPAEPAGLVCVGRIGAPHGVRGLVRLQSYTEDPEAIADYGPFTDAKGGRPLTLALAGVSGGQLLARVEGVENRDAAGALRGFALHVPRDRLPAPEEEDEFYHVDLIGLAAEDTDGAPLGRIVAVDDHGAGDVVEIALDARPGPPVALPFTRACFPVVDIAGGRVVVSLPEGLFDDDEGEEEDGADEDSGAGARERADA